MRTIYQSKILDYLQIRPDDALVLILMNRRVVEMTSL